MDKKKIYVKISGFVGLVMTFILLSGISVLATEQQAQGDLIIDTDVDEGYAYVGDGVQLLRGYEIMKGGTYKVSMAEGVTQTNEVILIDSDNPVILELDNVKISSLGLKQYFFGQTSYGTYYGAPAIWIDTNLQTDITIIYKGDCYLKGSNQWAAIMKYNRDTGGKLTLRSSGSDDDVLKLEGACGIGSHSDAASMSDNVCIENGHIIGSFGAEGVSNYVINDGYHVLEQRNSNSSTTVYPGIGTCTINGGTIVTRGPIDSSVVTYKGGNLYSKKEIHVVDGAGEETKLVVFPADEKLTGVVIDGNQSPCTANNSTNYQLYTFLTRKEHTVKLIFTDREEEYTVSFIGDKPIVTGDNTISVTYPDWAIQSIEKAIITGVPESMYYTGKRVTIPDLKVTLDGYELKEDNDYTVTYMNNKEVGRASFSIKGINTYKGTLYGNFEIKKKPEENNNNNNSATNNNTNNNSPNNNTSNINSTNNDNTNNNSTDNNNDTNNNNNTNNTNNTTEYVAPTPKPTGTTLPKSNYGSYYKVTSSSSSNPTATFTKPANKNTYSVYIDSTVYDDGVYYTVTTISDNAFKGCKNITYLSVPYSIKKIGKNAFKDCKKLETFTIYTTKLNSKNVGKNAFKGITKKTKIRVPKSKKKAYTKLFRKKGLSKKVKIVGI
ncbi:MAG: leucine-rich repeat domain-containing protein [Lachnospiraceae bacterium]|nr:leucine-rich repeat domain-containing protein [Lachnospiraceae bacterium]